jgi:LPXTG-site transpeptidase (sortase) family protein
MRQHRQFLVFTGFVAIGLALIFLFAPGNSRPSQASPLYLGITLTPSNVPLPTDTPEPIVATNTPLATRAPTATPRPTKKPDDPGTLVEQATPMLPESGVGAPDEELAALEDLPVIKAQNGPIGEIERLVIPSLKVNAWVKPVVYDGHSWDLTNILGEVAWLADSAYPWENENTVMTAHVRFKGLNVPFQFLPQIQNGALIYLYTARGTYTYRVMEQKLVEREDLSVVAPSGTAQLTLITCAKWDSRLSTYTRRQVVIAALVNNFFAQPALPPGSLQWE